MWYSVGFSVYLGETDYNGKSLGRPLVLKMTDEIFKELKEAQGPFGKFMWSLSKWSLSKMWPLSKKYREMIKAKAYHLALKKVGLDDFRPYFVKDHEHSLVVRASSPEEAKKKVVEKGEDLFKYCHIVLSPDEDLVIEESRLFN